LQRIALLFPGQGSQKVGMARDLYEASARVREVYERASEAIDFDLAAVTFDGPDDELTKTVNAQPALLVASISATTLLLERGFEPWAAAGHSLGEYSALVAARAMSLEGAVRAVRERGRLMYEAGLEKPGTMAAVIGMETDALESVIREARASGVVQIANVNSPTQLVISGEVEAVKKAMDLAGERGARRVIPLNVSGAFHSALLESARDGMADVLAGVPIEKPQCVFVANVTGGALSEPEAIRDNLVKQIVEPVQWVDCVRALANRGASLMVEVGPGNVLRGLVRKIDPEIKTMGAGTLQDVDKFLAAVAVG